MSSQTSLQDAGWSFVGDTPADVGTAVAHFLQSLPTPPRLLGFGEPMHGEEEFLRLRNQAFQYLVEHEGYRSIAIESDCLAAVTVNTFVLEGKGRLDEVMQSGFSHGFGDSEGNRKLVAWMHEYNRDLDAEDKLRFYGFDAPMEMTGAHSPRQALTSLHEYLAIYVGVDRLPCTAVTIAQLVGGEDRWSNPAAAMDPAQSVGTSEEAIKLRLITDDLVTVLNAEAPRLIAATSQDEWWWASLYGRTAAGLLRYHAGMADTQPSRVARLMGLRDTMMAGNLKAIADREAQRGSTLAFAHNRHLQKYLSKWQLGELALEWWSAGAIVGTQLGSHYAFLATALGSAPHRGLKAPGPETLEGALSVLPGSRYVFNSANLARSLSGRESKPVLRTDTSTNHGYFALDPNELEGTDGVMFIKEIR